MYYDIILENVLHFFCSCNIYYIYIFGIDGS